MSLTTFAYPSPEALSEHLLTDLLQRTAEVNARRQEARAAGRYVDDPDDVVLLSERIVARGPQRFAVFPGIPRAFELFDPREVPGLVGDGHDYAPATLPNGQVIYHAMNCEGGGAGPVILYQNHRMREGRRDPVGIVPIASWVYVTELDSVVEGSLSVQDLQERIVAEREAQ